MKSKFIKVIAFFLVLSISFLCVNVGAINEELDIRSEEVFIPEKSIDLNKNSKGELTFDQLETAKLERKDVPAMVTDKMISENGHVHRLYAQEEDEYTVIFQNNDGTKTAYYYSYPVKYKDSDGLFHDISNELVQADEAAKNSSYLYQNKSSDKKTFFPKNLESDGILLENGNICINMKPVFSSNIIKGKPSDKTPAASTESVLKDQYRDEQGVNNDSVIYSGVFGPDTSIRYTPTYDGFKEDIILDKYTGINTFGFELKTNGLTLISLDGVVLYLADPLTGELMAELGSLYVYDSYEGDPVYDEEGEEILLHETYNNKYIIEEIEQDNKYLVTIIADKAFLESPDTVYPVYIDPTVTIIDQGNVITAAVYSNSSKCYGMDSSREVMIGNHAYSYSYELSYGLVKFSSLTGPFGHLYKDQIKRIDLHMYYLGTTGTHAPTSLKVFEYYGAAWDPNYVAWNNFDIYNYGYSCPVTSTAINGTTGYKTFNITSAIKPLTTTQITSHKGLIIKHTESRLDGNGGVHRFASSKYGTASRRPYISMVYNDSPTECKEIVSGAVYNLRNGITQSRYLDIENFGTSSGSRALLYNFGGNNNQRFKITYMGSGEYKISPQHATSMVLSINSSKNVVLASDTSASANRWYIYYGGTYFHLVNKADPLHTLSTTSSLNNSTVISGTNYAYDNWALSYALEYHDNKLASKDKETLRLALATYYQARATYNKGQMSYIDFIALEKELNSEMNLIRADYILTRSNYSSTYANAVLPRRTLEYNSSNNMTGLDVVVIKRLLVLEGYLDFDVDYNVFDQETSGAVYEYNKTVIFSEYGYNEDDDTHRDPTENIPTPTSKITTSDYNKFLNNDLYTALSRTVTVIANLKLYGAHHRMVQVFYVIRLGGTMEVTIPGGGLFGGNGRADIVASGPQYQPGNYIWEIKPDKPIYYGGGLGSKQLRKYINTANTLGSITHQKLGITYSGSFYPGPQIIGHSIRFSDTTYLVTRPGEQAFYPDSGLILYDIKKSHEVPESSKVTLESEVEVVTNNYSPDPSSVSDYNIKSLLLVFGIVLVSAALVVGVATLGPVVAPAIPKLLPVSAMLYDAYVKYA